MTTTNETLVDSALYIAALQQIHALRAGIARIQREHPEAPPALLADLSALVCTAVDEAHEAKEGEE